MNRTLARSIAAAGLAFACGLGATALAQAAPSDQELQKFIAASRDVQKISSDYDAKIKAAKTTEEASKLDEVAGEKMEAAVKKQGLTEDRYTEIYTAMQGDDKIKARVADMAKK